MTLKIFLIFIMADAIFCGLVRIRRENDDISDLNADYDEGNTRNHCSEDIKKSFTCSEGSVDEIKSEVGIQANVLKIFGIPLPNIPDSVFQPFVNLVELAVTESNVTSISPKAFQGLANLEELNLSRNMINNLARSYFTQLDKLHSLNVSYNKIVSISATTFKGLTKLQDLDLSNNLIESLAAGMFTYLPEMITIDLSQNLLNNVPSSLFTSLTHLQTVNLANNKISQLNDGSFTDLPALKTLYLHANMLKTFSFNAFSNPVEQLNEISLNNNELIKMDPKELLKIFPTLKKMVVAPNPWDCDCLNFMLEIVDENGIEYSPREYFEGGLPVCRIAENSFNKEDPCLIIQPTTASAMTSPTTTTKPTSRTSVAPATKLTTSTIKTISPTIKYAIPFW